MDNFRPTNILRVSLLVLLFLAVIPYAGHDTWIEAYIVSALFCIAGFAAVFCNFANRNRLILPLIILGAYSLLQGLSAVLAFSGLLVSPLLPSSMDPVASIWSAIKIAGFAIAVATIGMLFRTRIVALYWSLIVIGTLNAAFGIVRFTFQQGDPESGKAFLLPALEPGVGFGTFINQNHFAYLMLMTLGLVSAAGLSRAFPGRARAVALGAAIVLFTALVLTGSRAGIIGSILVITAAIVFPPSLRFSNAGDSINFVSIGKRLGMVAIAVVGLIGGITLIGQDRVVDRFERIPMHLKRSSQSAAFTRPDVWLASISVIKDNPVYGVGFGSFRTAVTQHIDIAGSVVPKESHNDYLEIAASGGAVAVALAIWFLFAFFERVKQGVSGSAGASRAIQFGAIYSLSGVAFHSLFDFGLQLVGVWLFAAALIALAVHRQARLPFAENADGETGVQQIDRRKRLVFAGTMALLFTASFLFGTFRLQELLAQAGTPHAGLPKYFTVPFDSQSRETAAALNERAGDFEAAAEQLRLAVKYRPEDYDLWLRLAALEYKLGRIVQAEHAYTRSIQLAPRFGLPHFEYGNFLNDIGRVADGSEQLFLARRRDPELLEPIVEQAWERFGRNPAKLLNFLEPVNRAEREAVVGFLLAEKEYDGLLSAACGEDAVSTEFRRELVRNLTDNRQYRRAKMLSEANCDRYRVEITNGGFENDRLNDGAGFSWSTITKSPSVRAELDTAEKFADTRSLRFQFAGNISPSDRILSQLLAAAPGKYRFSFAYRTRALTSGGELICRLISRDQTGEHIVSEFPLLASDDKWTVIESAIQIGNETDALEVVITRSPCADRICPIFGQLWLDEFALLAG